MKFALAILLLLTGGTMAQDDPKWPPLNYLRSDYRESVVVAHVSVKDAEVANRIPGLEDWHITCEVVEQFKGKFRKGQTIVYYHGAEAGFKKELFLGEKIVFLQLQYHEKEKQWVYAAIENSTLAYNEDRARKLRIIQRMSKKKRTRRTR